MASSLGNLAATVSLNIDPFQQSTRVLDTQMRSIDRALKATETSFKNNSKNINAQKSQYNLTGKAIDVYNAQLKNQQEHYNKLKTEIGDFNNATSEQKTQLLSAESTINKTVGEIEKLTGQYDSLGKQIAINESNWTKAGQTLESFGSKTAQVGDGFSKFGTKWTVGVTAPIMAGVGGVTKAAMTWESSFAGVKKTNDEVVDSNGNVVYSYADLESGLRSLAKELPSTHTEIANVAEVAVQLGIKSQDVVSFTKTMIDLGESTNLSAEDAATAIAKLANITGMSSDEYERFGSSVVALGNNFATTESDIVQMATRLASAGTLAGLTETEILGLATAMSSVGIESEAGGTAMTQTLNSMENAATKGAGAFDTLQERAESSGSSLSELSLAVEHGGKELTAYAESVGMAPANLKKMYNEANKSAGALQQFADISGMSSAQFVAAWKDKPITAIQAFIKGLGELDEKGDSATQVLDDMGLSGIRQSNMLKSLALASDTLTGAIDMSNNAWEENTALSTEANTRYETVESQLAMLKNEVVDVAIEFGGPFLQALRDGLQAAKPFIETIGNLAKKFSEANPETQQAIMKFTLLTAAIGPAAKIFGSFLKIAGGGISTFGRVAQGIGKMSGTLTASKTAIDATTIGMGGLTKVAGVGATGLGGMTTAIATATTSLGGFTGALGLLTSPAGIAVAAIGGISLAAYAGKKAYEEHQLAGAKWGTEVTKEQDKVIQSSYDLRDDAVAAMNEYQDGVTSNADKVVEANQKIVDAIQSTLDKEVERKEEAAKNIENDATRKVAEEEIEWSKKVNEFQVSEAQKRVDRINDIMTNASNNSRQLSDEERTYIANNYTKLSDEQLKAANFSKEQRVAIESAYQDKLSDLTDKQLQARARTVKKGLNDEQADYEKQKEYIKTAFADNVTEQKKALDQLDQDHKRSNESMILAYAKLAEAQGLSVTQMDGMWQEYGWTTTEVQALVANSTKDMTKNLDMFAKGTSEADDMWNAMALDPKTGEVKTNMAETLVEMADTEKGWSDLRFMLKEADLTSNAKEEIGIAAGQADKWNELSIEEKHMVVDNDSAMLNLFDTIDEMGLWDEYEADRKKLGVDNADVAWKLAESTGQIDTWNELPVESKQMLVENEELLNRILTSDEALKAWNELPVGFKELIADNEDVMAKVEDGTISVQEYNTVEPLLKVLLGDSTNVKDESQKGETALNEYEKNDPKLKMLLGDSSSTRSESKSGESALTSYDKNKPAFKRLRGDSSSAKNASKTGETALNSYQRNNPKRKYLKATDNASGPAGRATSAVSDFRQQRDHTVTLTSIFKTIKRTITGHATGTNYHAGGHAMVNDQAGSIFKELVVEPNGNMYIPEGRNVVIPDLPRGSKVFTAAETNRMIPKYANGTDFTDTRLSRMNFVDNNVNNQSQQVQQQSPVFYIDRIIWNGKEDIRKSMQEMGRMVEMDRKGAMT